MAHPETTQNNAPTLVAILIAARRAGDRDLERFARGKLRDQYGVKLTFAKLPRRQGGTDER